VALLTACTQGQQNQLYKKAFEFLEGKFSDLRQCLNGEKMGDNYGKVTTREEGYYYFRDRQEAVLCRHL
jgi:hypothetical protein